MRKEAVANTYVQHKMWDDAEALLTEIINDFSTQQWEQGTGTATTDANQTATGWH